MEITCYFDYTCSYSYRGWLWLERLRSAGEELDVTWSGFVLKEVNRSEDEDSALAGPTIESIAVLALAFGEALRGRKTWELYHERIFRAMHETDERATEADVIRIARDSGLDIDSFRSNEVAWLEVVRQGHFGAIERWGVFGTPTLVLDGDSAVYLKLATLPDGGYRKLWDALTTITVSFPEVVELKRPRAPGST